MPFKRSLSLVAVFFFFALACFAQPLNSKTVFSRQDSLRGGINASRDWWDVLHYAISITPDIKAQTIVGKVEISYREKRKGNLMQIDMQEPMLIDKIEQGGEALSFTREGNVYWVTIKDAKSSKSSKASSANKTLDIYFHGTPRSAKNAPWDGGWVWKNDDKGRPFVTVAVQGLGASAWYPCKDHQSDEPDNGASLSMTVPDTLVAVANGKLKSKTPGNGTATYTWQVVNPINNYNIVPYIGKYVNFTETYKGEKANLNCSYWVLDYNLEKAKLQFKQAPMTLKAMEYWFGPYPWYEDDFKLVETSHLGMEHQSAVAYGNKYKNGYLGRDLSGTGVGLAWDYIIIHETGHEWFANNVTTKDIADMWVHEGFTTYSETLFTEFHFGKAKANKYLQGLRRNIRNDIPLIGPYGVNKEGSGDMYYKGANTLHTIRQVINNDVVFRKILRGLNKTFYHQTVTSAQVENYMSKVSGKDLSKIFNQYLRTIKIPVLKVEKTTTGFRYKWENTIDGFTMPVKLTNGTWLLPTNSWKSYKWKTPKTFVPQPDQNFYIQFNSNF